MSVPAASEIAAQVDMDANGSFQRSCAALPNLNMPVSSTLQKDKRLFGSLERFEAGMEQPPHPSATVDILNLADESSPEHIEYMHAQTATNCVVALQHQKTEHLIESTVVAQLYN
jgi:hypothetical protein